MKYNTSEFCHVNCSKTVFLTQVLNLNAGTAVKLTELTDSERLRIIMRRTGMKQKTLAQKLGISRSYLCMYLNGQRQGASIANKLSKLKLHKAFTAKPKKSHARKHAHSA